MGGAAWEVDMIRMIYYKQASMIVISKISEKSENDDRRSTHASIRTDSAHGAPSGDMELKF